MKSIVLDSNQIKSKVPAFSGFLNISWINLFIFVFSPAILFAANHVSKGFGWGVFFVSVGISVFIVAYSRNNFIHTRSPIRFYFTGLIFFSPRIFFPGAMLWYLNSSYPIGFELFIIVLWVFVEFIAYNRCWQIDDQAVISSFRKGFTNSEDGTVLYDSTIRVNKDNLNRETNGKKLLYYFENIGGYTLAVFGPIIFVISQLYRANFDPRYLIVTIICLVLGVGSRATLTDYYLAKRAIRLKQRSIATDV